MCAGLDTASMRCRVPQMLLIRRDFNAVLLSRSYHNGTFRDFRNVTADPTPPLLADLPRNWRFECTVRVWEKATAFAARIIVDAIDDICLFLRASAVVFRGRRLCRLVTKRCNGERNARNSFHSSSQSNCPRDPVICRTAFLISFFRSKQSYWYK